VVAYDLTKTQKNIVVIGRSEKVSVRGVPRKPNIQVYYKGETKSSLPRKKLIVAQLKEK
jgi:hypothetical protein